jgi:hypothetical protein
VCPKGFPDELDLISRPLPHPSETSGNCEIPLNSPCNDVVLGHPLPQIGTDIGTVDGDGDASSGIAGRNVSGWITIFVRLGDPMVQALTD